MSQLDPIAFDIETSGFDPDAVITVAGFAHSLGESLILNVDGRDAIPRQRLVAALDEASATGCRYSSTTWLIFSALGS